MRDTLVCTVNDAKLKAGTAVKERRRYMDDEDNDFGASRRMCWFQKQANVQGDTPAITYRW